MSALKLTRFSEIDCTPSPGYRSPYGPGGRSLTKAQKRECDELGLGVVEYINKRRSYGRR